MNITNRKSWQKITIWGTQTEPQITRIIHDPVQAAESPRRHSEGSDELAMPPSYPYGSHPQVMRRASVSKCHSRQQAHPTLPALEANGADRHRGRIISTIRDFPAWDLLVAGAQLSGHAQTPTDWLLPLCMHKCQALPVGTDSFFSVGAYKCTQSPKVGPSATHQQTQRAFFAVTHCPGVKLGPIRPTTHGPGMINPTLPAHRMPGKAWPQWPWARLQPSLSIWQHTSVVLQI